MEKTTTRAKTFGELKSGDTLYCKIAKQFHEARFRTIEPTLRSDSIRVNFNIIEGSVSSVVLFKENVEQAVGTSLYTTSKEIYEEWLSEAEYMQSLRNEAD